MENNASGRLDVPNLIFTTIVVILENRSSIGCSLFAYIQAFATKTFDKVSRFIFSCIDKIPLLAGGSSRWYSNDIFSISLGHGWDSQDFPSV